MQILLSQQFTRLGHLRVELVSDLRQDGACLEDRSFGFEDEEEVAMSHKARMIEAATWAALMGLVMLASAVGTLAAEGGCTTTVLGERIQLPNGAEYEASTLTICVTARYTPVSSLHKTYVDGMPVGMLISRRGVSPGEQLARPFMMFYRDSRGVLHLTGYARPAGGRLITYMLDQPSATATPWPDEQFSARKGSGTGAGTDGTDDPILVAVTAR